MWTLAACAFGDRRPAAIEVEEIDVISAYLARLKFIAKAP
jgi:hypothetical protein